MLKFPILKTKQIIIPDSQIIEAEKYIHDYWKTLRRSSPVDKGTLVGLPHDYVVPAARSTVGFHFGELYYWDSYFMALGLRDPEYHSLVEGMLDNLIYLYKRFSLIPNASRMYMTSRSQPPILTSYIFHVYDTHGKDTHWLKERMATAIDEYHTVWMSKEHPAWHNVHQELSRYYDVNMLHDLAEAESGWDMTPRFERKCLDYLPVDLNSLLYKYETDFARYEALLGNTKEAHKWLELADQRKDKMNKLMWAKIRGFYFDYNYQKKQLGDVWSLAGFYPMWARIATPEQAKRLVDNLVMFEKKGGLTTTLRPLVDMSIVFGSLNAQWAYPNGWAPLHYIVVEGLRNYGYHAEAERITRKWLKTNFDWFAKSGEFIEKYNVVNPLKPPVQGVYPSQSGFGWTNSIVTCFLKELND